MSSGTSSWEVGTVVVERVPYFDVGLDAASIDLDHVLDVEWAAPWLTNHQPAVGQAFWLIRVDETITVIDPCGASDDFLRSGPEAVDHQNAAFAALRAAGCDPDDVDHVVLTHLDGIGMTALADGSPAGAEQWRPAFRNAQVVISQSEYDHIVANPTMKSGGEAFLVLDASGLVEPVPVPYEIARGVTMRPTGAHTVGHCCIDIRSQEERAVMLGHLAISPLHAAVGVSVNHIDPDGAWQALVYELDQAATDGALVAASLWPYPGAARVVATDPYVLEPAHTP